MSDVTMTVLVRSSERGYEVYTSTQPSRQGRIKEARAKGSMYVAAHSNPDKIEALKNRLVALSK